jgi:uncharacterized protein (DUF302 family)
MAFAIKTPESGLKPDLDRYVPMTQRVSDVTGEPAVTTYLVPAPFDTALKAIREALARNDLSICAELDVSVRMKRELNMGFIPCTILLAESSDLLLEAAPPGRSAAVLFPLHVAVRAHGHQTLVHWINAAAIEGARLPIGATLALVKLQSLVTHSMDRIAMRQEIYPVSAVVR